MVVIKSDVKGPYFYHPVHCYYGDPTDDTTWELGESYKFDEEKKKHVREFIPLPYEPVFVLTDEEWLKNRILAYANENPFMCDIENRANVEGIREPYSRIMSASIPKGMVWLLHED